MKKLFRLISASGAGVWLAVCSGMGAEALRWEQRSGYRVAPAPVPAAGRTGFTLLSGDQTGLHFTNQLSYERSVTNQNLLNGAGVAAGDYDGDGLCDLYFCNLDGRNALYHNLGGWKFEDVTLGAGVACTNQTSRGAVFADINGDGYLDLIVTSLSGPNACLLNDGRGHFSDSTKASGITLKAGSESLALADVDGDGDLDLYITNNGENSILRSGGDISVRKVGGRDVVAGRDAQRYKIIAGQLIESGPPDVLYLNDGQGKFTPVSWTDGTFLTADGHPLRDAPRDLGLSVMFRDINGDGAPDLYVCNDFQTPDRIWINDGRGHFRALPDLAIRTTCLFSMGVDFADIDRDGRDDFLVVDMLSRFQTLRMTQFGTPNPPVEQIGEATDRHQARRNTLFWNRGDGTYAEMAHYAGVDASDWTWSVVFLDVDLDGYEDVLVANGHAYDTQDLDMMEKHPPPANRAASMRGGKNLKNFPTLHTPNFAFRNRGDRTFEEVGQRWGFHSTQISHGIALADLDNDGDLDVVVSCLWQAPLLYRNEATAPRVLVRLRGRPPNTRGIGAQIKVLAGAVALQTQQMIAGGRYLSADEPLRVFAAGTLTNKITLEVTWRSGARSVVADASPNHIYEIAEEKSVVSGQLSVAAKPDSQPTASTQQRTTDNGQRTKLFQDVSERIAHTHHDPPFNDLDRQPLLAKWLSTLGPGVAWYDLDGDGHDELIIGSGRGEPLALFRGDGKGSFSRAQGAPWMTLASDDITGVVGWIPAPGQRALLAGVSKYESHDGPGPTVLRFDANTPSPQPAVRAAQPDSPGPLAVADFDGDGDLDLFVGGRVVPGRYPEAASSRVYRNESGALQLDEANSALLRTVGLVNGAVWSDLTGDGWPELILACEWGPVRVFQNAAGKLRETTSEVRLSNYLGWWNGVTTGDLDGDGQLDIIASNWGLNSSYHSPTAQQPLRIYYGDFDGNGVVDLLEAYTDTVSGKVVPRRDMALLSSGLPLLRTRFASHKAFSQADASSVIGDSLARAQQVQANTLASMVFLNRRDHFAAVPLPAEAQLAPAFGVNVADLDGDGHEDLFLSQNFFAMRPQESRLDGGRSLCLRGNGTGQLTSVPGQDSGLIVYGEQRGSALGDFDEDGRVDLVVTQNGAATKLFRNQGARPGLTVRLAGPPGNPLGIGATMKLLFGEKPGPAREVHAGSGYWSQDSAVQVLATPQTATALWLRWPGGEVSSNAIPPGAREIVVKYPGKQ